MHELVAFDVDMTLIEGQSQRLLALHLAKHGMLSWPVLTQALWWFAKYHLRLTEDVDVGMNKVLRVFEDLPVSKMEHFLSEFCTTVIVPRLRKEAVAEICMQQTAGKKVILVSSSLSFLVQLISKHVGADGWVATELENVNGKLTGRISGRAVYSKEKFSALQNYADIRFGRWLLYAAYGDHGSDKWLLECAKNSVAVCPDRTLKKIANRKGWRIVVWS